MSGDRRFPGTGPDDAHGDLPPDLAPTAALLHAVLGRQADDVTPSPDGYARIRAGIERRGRVRPVPLRAHRFVPALAAAALVVAGLGAAVVQARVHRPGTSASPGGAVRLVDTDDVLTTPPTALPVYVAGRQNGRLVLFREFHQQTALADADAKVAAAVALALGAQPRDGDRVPLFAAGGHPVVRASVSPGLVSVDVRPAPRPASANPTREEATAALQQLVWTATAAAAVATAPAGATAATPATQTPRLVRLTLDGRAGALFGLVPLDHDVDRQFAGDPRARVWVIDPSDGEARRPGPLTASGDGVAGRDATVRVRLVRAGRTVAEQVVPLVPAPGSAGPLRPGQRGTWRVTGWDAATPGAYRLEVSAPDDGGIPWTDNAEFTVR